MFRAVIFTLCAAVASVTLCASPALAATATCTDNNICTCLGEASRFDVIAGQALKVRLGRTRNSGYTYPVSSGIAGSVCGQTASVAASTDAIIDIGGDMMLLAPAGSVAATFKAKGDGSAGTSLGGDLATAGGSIKGAELVFVNGVTDTSGTHPGITTCTQAMGDATAASTHFAALATTQDLGKLIVRGGSATPAVISTHAGVNVITATTIAVQPARVDGYREGSELQIDIDSSADSVIINTGSLRVGASCLVSLTGEVDQTKVIINVTGKAKVSKDASVEPAILAPTGSVIALTGSTVSSVFGRKVLIKGAQAGGILICSP